MNLKYEKYQEMYITYGKEIPDNSKFLYFPGSENKKTLSNIKINDLTYKHQTIIMINVDQTLPGFGEISNIYLVEGKIYFEYIPFKVYGFNEKYFAYSVEYDDVRKLISYDLLHSRLLGIICEKNNRLYIATRHRL